MEHTHEHAHQENVHQHTPWWENNWQFLVIAFGLIFVTLLVSFHPVTW